LIDFSYTLASSW